MQLRLSPDARADIDELFVHGVLEFGIAGAERYMTGLRTAFDRLVEFPMLGVERSQVTPPVRLLRYEAHHILYTVMILRVLHRSANWIDHLTR